MFTGSKAVKRILTKHRQININKCNALRKIIELHWVLGTVTFSVHFNSSKTLRQGFQNERVSGNIKLFLTISKSQLKS